MMAEHKGLVLNINEDGTAEVATDQNGFCNGCTDTAKCRMCLSGARLTASVQNHVDARKGDVVSICNDGFPLFGGVASLYVIPVLWLMIGAVVGGGLGAEWDVGEAGGAVLVGLSGFIVGFMIIFIVSKSLKSTLEPRPGIVRVLDRPGEGGGGYADEEQMAAPADIQCSVQ
jgi:positive regulator of sigma E activity